MKYRYILLLLLAGCSHSSEDNLNTVQSVNQTELSLSPKIIEELNSQPTIDEQLGVLYRHYEPLLDRSESLTGTDQDNNEVRDDIDYFIEALQVSEPVRKSLLDYARFFQENLYHDFSVENFDNIEIAISIANKQLPIIACQTYLGVDIHDLSNITDTFTALTYNTQSRVKAYLQYNHLLDGTTATLLEPKAEYCDY